MSRISSFHGTVRESCLFEARGSAGLCFTVLILRDLLTLGQLALAGVPFSSRTLSATASLSSSCHPPVVY